MKVKLNNNPATGTNVMPILTRTINSDISAKVQKYLQKRTYEGQNLGDNLYFNVFAVKDDAGNKLILDSLVHIDKNKITIFKIWEFEQTSRESLPPAKHLHGETGTHAKVLAEKYLEQFLAYIETLDLDSNVGFDFLLTPELHKQIESEIDKSVNPAHITEDAIKKYDRVELTIAAQTILHDFLEYLAIQDFKAKYNETSKTFDVSLNAENFNFSVSLSDVVERKWKDKQSFNKALTDIVYGILGKNNIEMAIITKHISKKVSDKAKKYLKKKTEKMSWLSENTYCNALGFIDPIGEQLYVDALIHLTDNKISIIKIWTAKDLKNGKPYEKNSHGETGANASYWAEKYLDGFLLHLKMVDLDNCDESDRILSLELIQQIENDIEKTIDLSNITEEDILKYDTRDLISFAQGSAQRLFEKIEMPEANFSFDKSSKTFNFSLIECPDYSHNSISLGDVVKRKLETGDHFPGALVGIICDILVTADIVE